MAKRTLAENERGPLSKRAKLLAESSDDSEDEEIDDAHNLKINSEYASRFEHNKEREEKQKLEEKYGAQPESNSDDESSSEDDDAGELINDGVDQEILATIKAIRAKDPRIYDGKATFYTEEDSPDDPHDDRSKAPKPMHLRDYHRNNLLSGNFENEEDDAPPPKTYAQEQEELKNDLVKQMHAAAEENEEVSDEETADGGFLVRKSKIEPSDPRRARKKNVQLDIKGAEKDPETFLSNFIQSNAWRTTSPSRFQPFDSDDEDDLKRADEFEEAYNRRFEDPKKSNAFLQSHSRDIIAKYSVRREEPSGRQKSRQSERDRKQTEKMERDEKKIRLKKLKVDEIERKVKEIRKAAGAASKDFQMEDWADVLEADFDDAQWEAEMQRRFGEEYYAAEDLEDSGDENDNGVAQSRKNKKPKKPKWDDDIDIKDIAPEVSDEEVGGVALDSDHEGVEGAEDGTERSSNKSKKNSKKERLRAKEEAKRVERRDRRLIENLVDQNIDIDLSASKKDKAKTGFRYRETSPKSFGLTPRDILLASDADLNQYAGLKKLHAFRDADKKRKDKKHLSKKARLRQWRRDTFGDEQEPQGGFERLLNNSTVENSAANTQTNKMVPLDENGDTGGQEKKKKKKRSKKSAKAPETEV